MKKLFAAWLTLLILTGLCLAEEPTTYTCDVWEYALTEEGAVITWWDWYDIEHQLPERVMLPTELDGHPVVGIGPNALNTFEMDSEISFILVVPEGVRFLQGAAFMCCHNAIAIHLPSTLADIPEYAFHHVGADIYVAEGNPRYVVQDGFLIDQQTSTLLYTMPSAMGQPLPAVRRIGEGSLDNWHDWDMSVVFPEGVEEIGAFALQDTALASLTLPEGLLLIEQDAIDGEIAQPVVIPASVRMIQRGNFTKETNTILCLGDSTHFETAEEFEARTGYPHWVDDWLEQE